MSRKRVPLNQNECTADFRIGVPFEQNLQVVLPQYSEKKRKIYEASKLYFEALTQAKSQEDIDRLGKRLAELEAEYSENPAYMAWVHQQYLEQKWKVKKNETNK